MLLFKMGILHLCFTNCDSSAHYIMVYDARKTFIDTCENNGAMNI